jgi:hypothetical protein
MGQREYFSNCVNWPRTCEEHFGAPYPEALDLLIENGETITLEAFRSELDGEAYSDLLTMLNYAQPEEEGLHIEDDYHVAFKREPGTGLVYAVHSAIEYVFATPDEVAELQEKAMRDEFKDAPEVLVLVHPGSMCGSARMFLGKSEADGARSAVLEEVAAHLGPIVVIDGFLSDELTSTEQAIIDEALSSNADAGHLAVRLWGCDAGEAPYPGWAPFGASMEGAVFEGQEKAATAIAPRLADHRIFVTGAWATEDLSSGCASSVLVALREALGDAAEVEHSDNVLYEPDPSLDDDCENEPDI